MHASRIRIIIGNAATGFARTYDKPASRRDQRTLGAEIKAALGLVDTRPRRRRHTRTA